MRTLATVLVCALVVGCGEDAPEESARMLAAPDAGELEPVTDSGAMAKPQGDAAAERADSAAGDAAAPADAGALQDASTTVDAGQDAGPKQRHVSSEEFQFGVLSTCGNCHSPIEASTADFHMPILGWSVPYPVSEVSTCNGLTYVVPGSIEQSYLYVKLLPGAPCGQHAPVDELTAEKLSKFRDWILTGATED